jgi:signal transduction histidine kinase
VNQLGLDLNASFLCVRFKNVLRTIPKCAARGIGLMVTVSDTGPGISEDKLKRIFEPFVTSKDHGTGLGLSIARTIIESYGGKIWAENSLGGGAVFRFTLSLADVKNRDRSVSALSTVTRPVTSAQQKGPTP